MGWGAQLKVGLDLVPFFHKLVKCDSFHFIA
jgi:hypothetical protein